MIQLNNVRIDSHRLKDAPLLRPTSLTFARQARIGILAAPGSGKTTLARHLSGLETPSSGSIRLTGDVSWPLGVAGFLHPHLTISQNLTTIAKLKNIASSKYIAWCLAFCEFDTSPNLKIADLSPSERALLAYASVVCLTWDFLVADETITVGETAMRMKCDAIIRQHLTTAGLIFISRSPARLKDYCDTFLVLINGTLRHCPDPEAGNLALALSNNRSQEILAHV